MIDIESLKQFLGSDEEFIGILMDKFITEIPKDTASLNEATLAKDWPRVRGVSHKMLSSTKIFSFEELSGQLQKIEKYSETKTNLDEIPGLVSDFSQASNQALEEMKEYRKKMKV